MLDRLTRDKHSGLLQKFVNYDHKKFYNIGPRSHAISVLRQYEKEHAKKMEDLINGLIHQMQLLFEG